ncbi:hypothetical protein D7I39_21760 [Allopusillimonas ginsengisoli]|nr:hypothetical protein D7I39_21760 [Allopusillimonas ginsengisoli]
METLNWNPRALLDDEKRLRYNVLPGSLRVTFHRLCDGSKQADRLYGQLTALLQRHLILQI